MREAYQDILRLFMSPDPSDRQTAAVAGVINYARSRLSPAQFGQFVAWCQGLGLPSAPGEANGTGRPNPEEAMLSMVMGLMSTITEENLHEYGINLAGLSVDDLTIGTCLTVLTDTLFGTGDVAGDGTVHLDVTANGLAVVGDLEVNSDIEDPAQIPQNNVAVGPTPPTPENRGLATDGPVQGGSFVFNDEMAQANGEVDAAAGLTILYVDPHRGLMQRKGTATLSRLGVGGPSWDSYWMELRPGIRTSTTGAPTAADIQAPLQYSFQIDFPTNAASSLVGGQDEFVDYQIFIKDGTGDQHVISGGMLTGNQTPPTEATHELSGINVQFLYDATTTSVRASFHLGPLSLTHGGYTNIAQARLLLWSRGGL